MLKLASVWNMWIDFLSFKIIFQILISQKNWEFCITEFPTNVSQQKYNNIFAPL